MLHKSGIDPDFHYTKKFSLDVDPLIGMCMCVQVTAELHAVFVFYSEGLVDKDKVDEAEGKVFELEHLVRLAVLCHCQPNLLALFHRVCVCVCCLCSLPKRKVIAMRQRPGCTQPWSR